MKKYLPLVIVGILSFLGGYSFKDSPSQNLGAVDLDCKGQECRVQVLVNKENYKDAIYYTPEQWSAITPEVAEAETTARFENWKKVVAEASKATSSPILEEPISDEVIP